MSAVLYKPLDSKLRDLRYIQAKESFFFTITPLLSRPFCPRSNKVRAGFVRKILFLSV
jgi:hypothetical protein